MVKYKYNENWRERDKVYEEMPDARITPAKAALLVAVRQFHTMRG